MKRELKGAERVICEALRLHKNLMKRELKGYYVKINVEHETESHEKRVERYPPSTWTLVSVENLMKRELKVH